MSLDEDKQGDLGGGTLVVGQTRIELIPVFILSSVFIAGGIACEYGVRLIIDENRETESLYWFHILPAILIFGGLMAASYGFFDFFRHVSYVIDVDQFCCVDRFGPFTRKRAWPRSEIAFAKVRDLDPIELRRVSSRLELVLTDGKSISISPLRLRSVLKEVCASINLEIQSAPRRSRAEASPLGSNILLLTTPERLSLLVKPISPQAVPGGLYLFGVCLLVGGPAMGLWIAAISSSVPMQRVFQVAFFSMLGLVVLSCIVAGCYLVIWIHSVAKTGYKVTIDKMTIAVEEAGFRSHQYEVHSVNDITDIQHTVLMSQIENERGERLLIPKIVSLEMVTGNGHRFRFLCGRPLDETISVLDAVRTFLGLSPSVLRSLL